MKNVRKLQEYYNTVYKEGQFVADLNRKDRLEFLFKDRPNGMKILNIGCGPGIDINFLTRTNEVHGIDISDSALHAAKSIGIIPHKIDLSSTKKLPFGNAELDIVIATDILEHLFFPQNLLHEMHRVCKPSGFIIASVPNHFYWTMRIRILLGKGIILPFHNAKTWDYFHIRFFTSASFEYLLNISDFNIQQKFYDQFTQCPSFLPIFLKKIFARNFPDLFSAHFMIKAIKI